MCSTSAIPVTRCLRLRPHTWSSQQSFGPIARARVDRQSSGSFPHGSDSARPPAAAQLSVRGGTGPLSACSKQHSARMTIVEV